MQLLKISCPSCGAPAKFDIENQIYSCSFCDGKVEIENAVDEQNERQEKIKKRIAEEQKNYFFETSNCKNCGATLIFEKNEAISNCDFCGSSLVRKKYAHDKELPRVIIPFCLTKEEATEKLKQWCVENKRKPEAKRIISKIDALNGYYLPYQMISGPVHCEIKKTGQTTKYEADSYLNGEFVNCSKQLDNLELDAMEPYDLEELREFDFSYVAGQRVKISDIKSADIQNRFEEETDSNYRLIFEKIWGTKAIYLNTTVTKVVQTPALLPVYYIKEQNVSATVNGQTGKVSVRADKESRFISLPWWLEALLVLALTLAVTYGLIIWRSKDTVLSLYITGVLSVFYLIVLLCMFEPGMSNKGSIITYRNIFTSGEQTFKREKGRLIPREEVLKRKIDDPVFMRRLDKEEVPVTYIFRSPARILSMIMLSIVTIFLPVIIALFINGFDFERLTLGGSAVWFCITVPTVPIMLIRLGFQELYNTPWIYIVSENGEKKRYKKGRGEKNIGKVIWKNVKIALGALLIPPVCLLTWFILASFGVMVYLTAFGM